MRFHVVSLPHTQVTRAFSACAYTQKVRKFCNMMTSHGHQVFLYAGDWSETDGALLTSCISEYERARVVGDGAYVDASFDYTLPHWTSFNTNAIKHIGDFKQKGDFLCLIGGIAQKSIADAHPDLVCVEFGIGYGGVFDPSFKVYESQCWRNVVEGARSNNNPTGLNGKFFDTVIPNSFEIHDFPFLSRTKRTQNEEYYLYLGRRIDRKGWKLAADVCQVAGVSLITAGPGEIPEGIYGKHLGEVGPELRGTLLANATAVFTPTLYVEPFCGVHIEAMLCGTPVITTDFGVFPETVENGVNGWRCSLFREFVSAVSSARELTDEERWDIRCAAQAKYGTEVVYYDYLDYFTRLQTLFGEGFYAPHSS